MQLRHYIVALLVLMQPASSLEARSRSELLASITSDLKALRLSIWQFWACHGLDDPKHGGFHANVGRDGTPTPPEDKGIVQQTRHAWAFSTYYQHGYNTMPEPGGPAPCRSSATHFKPSSDAVPHLMAEQTGVASLRQPYQHTAAEPAESADPSRPASLPTSKQMAAAAYNFTVEHMYDASNNMFHWAVSRDGRRVVQSDKALYGQWFVLYGLSAYYSTFRVGQARRLALECFRAVDQAWHNATTGGYNEGYDNMIPPDPPEPKPHTEVHPRTLNVLMHGLEALAALHQATKDATVLARLLELLSILCTKLHLVDGMLFEKYNPGMRGATWMPPKDDIVIYGHNLESTWLVADTLDYLLSIKAIAPALATGYRATAMSVGAAAVKASYDSQHGGVFEHSQPGTATNVTSKAKIWWVQAESMLGLWKLYKYYDNDKQYLEKLADIVKFVRNHVTDAMYGEQYWQVEEKGTYNLGMDPAHGAKGNKWKASYHNSRAVLFLEQWIKAELAQPATSGTASVEPDV